MKYQCTPFSDCLFTETEIFCLREDYDMLTGPLLCTSDVELLVVMEFITFHVSIRVCCNVIRAGVILQ